MTTKTHPKSAARPSAAVHEPAARATTVQHKGAVDTAAHLSEDVLKSVEHGQRAAIEAVRKFVDTVDEMLPAIGDRPSRRETVINGALEMADKLVTTQYDFLREVVRSAERALSESGPANK